ncbi:uncharacterized protein TRIADDRAFT_24566, partial [Trichoplax adhaerens]
ATCPSLCNKPTVIVMMGLPARGKTYLARKLARYFNWINISTKVFCIGEYRRQQYGPGKRFDYYDPRNKEAKQQLKCCLKVALDDIVEFLTKDGEVAVLDGCNTTMGQRKMILDSCQHQFFKVFWIESIVDDPEVERHYIKEVKSDSPDYVGMDSEQFLDDFYKRIENYKKTYATLNGENDKCLSYIKVFNLSKKFLVHKISGHIQSRSVYFLMNTHMGHREIYLTRHGESMYNLEGKIGGDADLSERGLLYAEKLGEFMKNQNVSGLQIWTSQLKRTYQTATYIEEATVEKWKALNEIDAGVCDGLTYKEIEERYPRDFALRDEDKYHYRYPRGESYEDLVNRLEPVIMELERANNVLVVCHQGVMRCLLSYYLEKSPRELPYLKIPLHHVMKLTPVAYGCKQECFSLNIQAVDTHRERPAVSRIV